MLHNVIHHIKIYSWLAGELCATNIEFFAHCRLAGPEKTFGWMKEGRRIIPILPRATPLTGLTPIARNAADDKAEHNKKLLPPCQTASLPVPPQIPKPPHLRSPTQIGRAHV